MSSTICTAPIWLSVTNNDGSTSRGRISTQLRADLLGAGRGRTLSGGLQRSVEHHSRTPPAMARHTRHHHRGGQRRASPHARTHRVEPADDQNLPVCANAAMSSQRPLSLSPIIQYDVGPSSWPADAVKSLNEGVAPNPSPLISASSQRHLATLGRCRRPNNCSAKFRKSLSSSRPSRSLLDVHRAGAHADDRG